MTRKKIVTIAGFSAAVLIGGTLGVSAVTGGFATWSKSSEESSMSEESIVSSSSESVSDSSESSAIQSSINSSKSTIKSSVSSQQEKAGFKNFKINIGSVSDKGIVTFLGGYIDLTYNSISFDIEVTDPSASSNGDITVFMESGATLTETNGTVNQWQGYSNKQLKFSLSDAQNCHQVTVTYHLTNGQETTAVIDLGV